MSNKIPILFFLQNLFGFGGTEKYLYELTKRLNREKYIPYVACFSLKERMKTAFMKIDVEVTEFPVKKLFDFNAFKYGIALYNHLKEKQIRLIMNRDPAIKKESKQESER